MPDARAPMPSKTTRPRITTALPGEAEELLAFCQDHLTPEQQDDEAGAALTGLRQRLAERCVLTARHEGEPLGLVALDLDRGELLGPLVTPPWRDRGLGRRLVVAAERRAASFQLFHLAARSESATRGFLAACGYEPAGRGQQGRLERAFPRRQTRYGRRVGRIGQALGIPADYAQRHRLSLQEEALRLADAGLDLYERPQRLAPRAASAWRRLRGAAAEDGIQLDLVSAFRDLDYQAGLLRRKLERGQSMDDILAVSAAPGYSEHHTGQALDLTTPGAPVLETPFEDTDAFAWLQRHAADHRFYLSYPRDNLHGLAYEPWHWRFDSNRRA